MKKRQKRKLPGMRGVPRARGYGKIEGGTHKKPIKINEWGGTKKKPKCRIGWKCDPSRREKKKIIWEGRFVRKVSEESSLDG